MMKMISSSDLEEDSSKSFHLFNCYLLLLEQFIPKSIFVVIGRSRTSFMDLTDAIIKFQSLLAKGEKRTISKAEVGKFITYLQLLKHSKSGIKGRVQFLRSEIARLEDQKGKTRAEVLHQERAFSRSKDLPKIELLWQPKV